MGNDSALNFATISMDITGKDNPVLELDWDTDMETEFMIGAAPDPWEMICSWTSC